MMETGTYKGTGVRVSLHSKCRIRWRVDRNSLGYTASVEQLELASVGLAYFGVREEEGRWPDLSEKLNIWILLNWDKYY